uniref:Synaptotagmin XV n=1 Tax=Poecilia latipinna TaxID=48699 RepID=A0A3B3VY91_9TELE
MLHECPTSAHPRPTAPASCCPFCQAHHSLQTGPSDMIFFFPDTVQKRRWRPILGCFVASPPPHRCSLGTCLKTPRPGWSWYPVGSVLTGLYSMTPLSEVAAPPLGMATRLCLSVEYRHSSEQLVVSLLRLSNLLPRFHSNMTLVELRLLPDDRRPRQAKARGTGPDPEFNDCLIFQVSAVCVLRSTLSVCVLSVEKDGKRHAVGRVLFPLEGELGQAGRVLWRDLDPEEETQCSELGDVQISLSYSSSLQRLSLVVLGARGLQLLTDAGLKSVCVQVSLQIHTQMVKTKRSCVVKGEQDPIFNYRMTFKLRPQHLDDACLRFELQHPNDNRSALLGVLVLGPFMYARGLQLQHWMDMINKAQEPVRMWHRLGRAI